MSKKTFVQIVDTLAMGGTERMSANIGAVMAEQGWESHLIVSRRGGGMESHIHPEVKLHFLNKTSFYDLRAFWRLLRLCKKLKPTVVHAHSTSIYWAIFLKIMTKQFLLVWHDHFGLSDQLEKYPRKEFVILSKWIDRFVVVNEKLEKYWQGLIPYRIKDIRMIVNFPYLRLGSESKSLIPTFLNIANFRPQKDQINLIRASKILENRGYNFKVLLVGEFVENDWKNQVIQSIRDLSLDSKVEVVGPLEDVSRILSTSHFGVLSSESEGLPVALLEYGIASLPVICTNVGDCKKVISSSDLGILIPPSDASALADGMQSMLDHPVEAIEMGERLKEKVESEFGKICFLKSYLEILNLTSLK